MAHKIQVKRGNKANLPTLDVGEFGLCQDTNELFIGSSGNQKIFPPTAPTISDVEGLQTALDGKVDDSQVLTNVPANAKFTDTVTTINGKTGAIAKADITALGIPAQDTVYTHPTTAGNKHIPTGGASNQILKYSASGTAVWANESVTPVVDSLTSTDTDKALSANQGKVLNNLISNISASDVGLGNVDNVKQMPIAGGTFTGVAKAQVNTSYTTAQLRNTILSTADPSGGSNGDIWIKYT